MTIILNLAASACYGYEDVAGFWIAAASNATWNNGKICGQKFWVKCTGGANLAPNPCYSGGIVVTVVDYCPKCRATLNLSLLAFSVIADFDAGRVKIYYEKYPMLK